MVGLQFILKSESQIFPAPSLFLKLSLAIQGLLFSLTNMIFFSSMKSVIGNFIMIVLNIQISLGSIVTLMILFLLIQEHGISFLLFVSSQINLIIFGVQLFCLIKQVYSYVWDFSLISFKHFVVSKQKFERFLCIYLVSFNITTFTDELQQFSSSISIYNIKSYANSGNFTASFPVWIPLISYSSLIAIARIYKHMLNNSDEYGYPCLR